MNGNQEKHLVSKILQRMDARLEYLMQFEEWLRVEPPMILFWCCRRWLRERPVLEEEQHEPGT